MDNLRKLREANPHIRIHTVHEAAFRRYGSVIQEDTSALCAAAETLPFPEEGSKYVASTPELDEIPAAARLRETHCGGLDEQIGLCWGHSHQLNALEWHTCSEVNIAIEDLILLLGDRRDIDGDNRYDSSRIKAFRLRRGEAIEVYATTLHFCPIETKPEGFGCVVGLLKGTNTPLEEPCDDPLLFCTNKWLMAHEDNAALIARGAVAGIYGENYEL